MKKRIYQTDDSLGSDIKPRILNDGTPFFVKESAICSSVRIRVISAISFLSIISLKNGHLNAESLVQNGVWWVYWVIKTGIIRFACDLNVISFIFYLKVFQQ